jgi:acetyl esterase/lipase
VTENIRLWPGVAPGSENATHAEASFSAEFGGGYLLRNVVEPTLTAYLPDPALANGTAVVVAPGGGFHFLSWDNEGTRIAEWLSERGVSAFLLKYRVADTGATDAHFAAKVMSLQAEWAPDGVVRPVDLDGLAPEVQELAYADGREAVRLIRTGASEWGIDPAKVGFLGFSAGAFVTVAVALSDDPAVRPDFVAPIYGGSVRGAMVPADAPPLFAVVAADDTLCRDHCVSTVQAWLQAGRPAELHLYEQGGHGFGASKTGHPVDGWLDRLAEWMQTRGFLS